MQQVLFEGEFLRRVRPNTWMFRDKTKGIIEMIYIDEYTPIMYGICYTVQCTPNAKIIDGHRVWNKTVHSLFFPLSPFRESWDPLFYLSTVVNNQEAVRWVRFDLDFHIQSLIPTIPAIQYVQHVQTQTLEGLDTLVYKIGGVDPIALKRAGGNQTQILDSYHLKLVTDLCKQHRCVWLNDTQCAVFTVVDNKTNDSMRRLLEKKCLEKRERSHGGVEIALTWMADLERSFQIGSSEFTFVRGKAPPYIRTRKLTINSREADTRLRMDHDVDQKKLPISFCRDIEWTNIGTEADIKSVVRHPNIKSCIEAVKKRVIELKPKTILTFSSSGDAQFDVYGSWSCLYNNQLVDVRLCVQNSKNLVVNGNEMDMDVVLQGLKYVGKSKWTNIHSLCVHTPDLVVGMFLLKEDESWLPWMEKFKTERILVGL
jgi:hypothetical protein